MHALSTLEFTVNLGGLDFDIFAEVETEESRLFKGELVWDVTDFSARSVATGEYVGDRNVLAQLRPLVNETTEELI